MILGYFVFFYDFIIIDSQDDYLIIRNIFGELFVTEVFQIMGGIYYYSF